IQAPTDIAAWASAVPSKSWFVPTSDTDPAALWEGALAFPNSLYLLDVDHLDAIGEALQRAIPNAEPIQFTPTVKFPGINWSRIDAQVPVIRKKTPPGPCVGTICE